MKKDKQNKIEIIDFKDSYQNFPEDMKPILFPLLDNLSFIYKQLQELQEDIEKNGTIQEYQNGAHQKGYKQSASVQAYCSLIKSYVMISTRINKLLPEPEEISPKGKLEQFIDYLNEE